MPSLRKMLRRWASMVRGLRNSCAPTSLDVAPAAASRARGGAELAEEVAEVGFGGARAQEQRRPDLPRRRSCRHQPRDVQLLRGERVGGLGAAGARVLPGGAQLARGA